MLRRSIGVWTAACLAAAGALAGAEAPVADAVQALDRQALHALLEASADVNAAQADGMTALHWAARHDDLGSPTCCWKLALTQASRTATA